MNQAKRVYCKSNDCRRYANLINGVCPSCATPDVDAGNESNTCVCNICSEQIDDSSPASTVSCDSCKNWFHSTCAGPPEFVKLMELLSETEGASTMKGLLLWVCPNCSNGPKTLTLECADSQCTISETVVTPAEPAKTMSETSYGTKCEKFLNNICPHGISGKGCDDYHPKMCKPFIRFGPGGKKRL